MENKKPLIHTGSAAETFVGSTTIGRERLNLSINYNMVKENHRDQRLVDFLKELELTEGRATGFPRIHKAIEKNGSPKHEITTDVGRNFFLVVFKKHPLAQVELNETEEKILHLCSVEPKSKLEMAKLFGYNSVPGNIKRSVQKLIKEELLEYTIPERLRSSNQKYKITQKGHNVFNSME